MPATDSELPRDWFARAEEDLCAAQILLDAGGPLAIVGFHIQQAVEKSLKGYLLSTGWRLRRIHNLEELLREAVQRDHAFSRFLIACQKITQYYVESRYPVGITSELTRGEIAESLNDAQELIAAVKRKTG